MRALIAALTIAAALAVAACSSVKEEVQGNVPFFSSDVIMPPIGSSDMPPDEVARIIERIEERNRFVEDTPEWIAQSYRGLLIRKLTSLSSSEYQRYAKYLDKGTAYVMVHPSFFPFFHYPRRLTNMDPYDKDNVVERLLKIKPDTFQFALLQAQERRMRDFLEFTSTRQALLIIVIPKNYPEYSGYTYRGGPDEYMRYLNEVTNLSDSVLFVESKSPNRGYLTEEDAMRLMEFLVTVNAERVVVGGGYVGRCLEDFYALLTQEYGVEGIYVVPELADVSPREMSGPLAKELLKPDGSIDEVKAAEMMIQDVYNVQETTPRVIHLK